MTECCLSRCYCFSNFLSKLPFCVHVTAELGDFDAECHTPGFISEFRFIANQTEDLEMGIFDKYKNSPYVHVIFLY